MAIIKGLRMVARWELQDSNLRRLHVILAFFLTCSCILLYKFPELPVPTIMLFTVVRRTKGTGSTYTAIFFVIVQSVPISLILFFLTVDCLVQIPLLVLLPSLYWANKTFQKFWLELLSSALFSHIANC